MEYFLATETYRMIDALRDYADTCYDDVARECLDAAARIDGEPVINGMRLVSNFDRDAAHSATIGLLTEAAERADNLRREAAAADAEAARWEAALLIYNG